MSFSKGSYGWSRRTYRDHENHPHSAILQSFRYNGSLQDRPKLIWTISLLEGICTAMVHCSKKFRELLHNIRPVVWPSFVPSWTPICKCYKDSYYSQEGTSLHIWTVQVEPPSFCHDFVFILRLHKVSTFFSVSCILLGWVCMAHVDIGPLL